MEIYRPSKLTRQRVFRICGTKLEFGEGFEEFNAVRAAFNRRAFMAQVEMTEGYEKQITSMEQLLTKGVAIMERINRESAEFAVSVMMHYGIDWVTPDFMVTVHPGYEEFTEDGRRNYYEMYWESVFRDLIQNSLAPIQAKVKTVTDFQKELSLQRQLERGSRSHWQGGGFGLKGAVKGAMMAGLMNAGTNVLRGIGDSFIDSEDESRVQFLKNSVVDGAMPLANFNYIVKAYVHHLFEITKGYLCNTFSSVSQYRYQGEGKLINFSSKIEIEEAIRKFQNYELFYKNGAKTAEEVKSAIFDYMCVNIWDINALRSLYLLSESAADKKSVIELTPYLGLQYEFANIALNIDEDLIEKATKRKVADSELMRIRKEVEDRAKLIDFLITADEKQLESHLIAQNYISQKGFYIEKSALDGAADISAQEDYTTFRDTEADTFVLSCKGEPVNGKIKIVTAQYTYEGDMTDGRVTGSGRAEYTTGIIFEGEFRDFMLLKGKRIATNSQTTYEGTFQFDKETRKNNYVNGKLTFGSGGSYEGEFSGMDPHGHGTAVGKDGSIYKGQFVKGIKEGNGVITTDEYVFDGLFSNNHMSSGMVTYKNGESYSGDIKTDKGVWQKSGKGTFVYANGQTYTGMWESDMRHGMGTLTEKNGSVIYDGEWVNNARKSGGFFAKLKDKWQG